MGTNQEYDTMGQYISINPWSNKEIARFDTIPINDLKSLLRSGEKAQKKWSTLSLQERLARIETLRDTLQVNYRHYALSITNEMGKKIAEAEAEVLKCASLCNYYLENAEALLKDKKYSTDSSKVVLRSRPQGIVFGIMPWNFPFWQVFRFAIPNLILGNVVWVKHASNVGMSAALIEEAFTVSGFPKQVYTNVYIESKDVEHIIKDKGVYCVSLTGSEDAGRSVASIAGKHLKKTVLELGGNNAFVLLEDVPIKKAVQEAVSARLVNAGQSCIAAKRFIIPKKLEADFINLLEIELSTLKLGDPLLATTDIAPLARLDLAEQLEGQVTRSVALGAELVGQLERERGCFKPSILRKVKAGMPAFDEELFGPVFSICSYKSEKEAIKLVNNSSFGLGATVFGRDKKRAVHIANQLNEGSVYINKGVYSHPAIPFGGVKNSGYGREMAEQGLLEFANIQPLVIPL